MKQFALNESTPETIRVSPRCAGSIYLVTLITIAAISSMVLVGVKLRSANNMKSLYVEEMSSSSHASMSAIEYSLQFIRSDSDWNITAQSGIPFPEFELDGMRYSGRVVDSETMESPTMSTSTYQIEINTSNDIVSESYQIEAVYSNVDYLNMLSKYSATHYWPLNESKGAGLAT
ncbi:MAG: hypothetical protein JJ974_06060, partial [Phycisphaerales bacterium]|nr:hypothetical protein [Phycisphaerales bacterium]